MVLWTVRVQEKRQVCQVYLVFFLCNVLRHFEHFLYVQEGWNLLCMENGGAGNDEQYEKRDVFTHDSGCFMLKWRMWEETGGRHNGLFFLRLRCLAFGLRLRSRRLQLLAGFE